MLKINELVKAIDLAQAIGQRPYGHFDHDAKCFSGPSSNGSHAKGGDVKNSLSPSGIEIKTRFESFEDPETGEVLYRAL